PVGVQRHLNGGRSGGVIAYLTLHLLIRTGGPIVGHRKFGAERHLAFADRGGEAVDEELVDRHFAGTVLPTHDHGRPGGERGRRPVARRVVVAQTANDRT